MHNKRSKRTDSGLLILKMHVRPTYVPFDHVDDIAAVFTSENDHNPFVAAICPKCGGCGESIGLVPADYNFNLLIDDPEAGDSVVGWHVDFGGCPRCNGSGVIDEPARLFNNDKPPETVRANANSVARCPNCGLRFSTKVRGIWTGWRHCCGQRLIVEHE